MRKPRPVSLLLPLILILATAVAGSTALARGRTSVVASFTFSPASPVTGDLITFSSTSVATGTRNSVTTHDWDLDGDGKYDDATGPTVQRSFLTSGPHMIGLRAGDSHHNKSETFQTVTVSRDRAALPGRLLSPFPIVRIAGRVSRRGTRLWRLSVAAPDGATVRVRCRGRGCPLRRQSRKASVDFDVTQNGLKVIRFRRLEHRLLRRGVVMKVFVTRPGGVGKYVRFKMRRKRPPLRSDRCAVSGTTVPVTCPLS